MDEDKFKMSEDEVFLFELIKEKIENVSIWHTILNEDESKIFIMLKEKIQLHYEPLCKMLKKQGKLPFFRPYEGFCDLHARIYNWGSDEDRPYDKGLILDNRNYNQSDLMVPIDVLFMTKKELSKLKFEFVNPYQGVLVYDIVASVRRPA